MASRYLITWEDQEHVIQNIYLGRKWAMNMAVDFAEAKRLEIGPKPITIKHQDDFSGTWETWRAVTFFEGAWGEWIETKKK